MVSKFFAVLLIAMLSLSAAADVVIPGHIKKQFMFINLDKFPGFTFSYLHYSYHYDKGYQENPADTAAVANNKRYFVSEKGEQKETLMARDSKGMYFFSDIKFGGAAVVNPSINELVEVYSIVSIKDGIVKIKKIKEIIVYRNGKEKTRKSGLGLAGWIGSDGFTSGLAIVSTGALLGLLLLFLLRKRKPNYIQLTT